MIDLESEITQLESMLADPQVNRINRIGLENRLKKAKFILNEIKMNDQIPNEAITVTGKVLNKTMTELMQLVEENARLEDENYYLRHLRVNCECGDEICTVVKERESLKEENARLKAELAERKRVIVQAAIPLEGMVSSGTHRLQSELVTNEIEAAVTLIRQAMSKGGEG